MADPKNETGKQASQKSGSDSGSGGKISAGTSVGHVGESPMPHAQDNGKSAQSTVRASHTSHPLGGQDSGGSRSQGQSGGVTEKAQQAVEQTGEKVREAAEQARHKATEAYESASEWAQDTYERASDWASDRYRHQQERLGHMRDRSMRQFGRARNGVQNYIAENPMVVGIVGLAAGLLLGALLPRTRREDAMFGEWADEVRNQGLRYARAATERGREYVEETFSGDEERFSRHESEFEPDRTRSNPH